MLRICAGEALLLDDEEVDFIDLVNKADSLDGLLLDDSVDPDDYTTAELAVEYYCTRYGVQRHAKGDRVEGVQSTYRRYLIPFLVELEAGRPVDRRGVAELRITHLETLPRVLAGDLPLPASTVAGDLLRRRGIACLFLSPADAARVTAGGLRALEVAIAAGDLPVRTDARTGADIVAAADLRLAGLLVENTAPHGIARSTAANVLRDLALAIERARDHGARVRGRLKLEAIEPLTPNRLRVPKPDAHYISLGAVAATNAHLRIIGQVVLWIARLIGLRISEVYGLHVADFVRDNTGRPWLVIDKQGGISSLGRDPETGQFRAQTAKPGTKSPAGVRTLPIPRLLGTLLDMLVEIFHTDFDTGKINWAGRLIPGLQEEDTSGQSTMYGWLKKAQMLTGDVFDRHDLRAALITDLKNAGVDERLRHYYAGHEQPDGTIQDLHYDLGPYPADLHPIADLLDAKIVAELGTSDLRQPTALRESWGRGTRRYQQKAAIEQRLVECGWGVTEPADARLGRLLQAAEVAEMIGMSAPQTRRLMREGTIASHSRPRGDQKVWCAFEADVDRYLNGIGGITITELSAELNRSYHQVWRLVRDLDLAIVDRLPGASLRLTTDAANQVRAEVSRRNGVSACAATVQEAAGLLQLEIVTVETLIRQRQLELTDGPDNTRHRYVTRASIDRYNGMHPAVPDAVQASVSTEDERLTCSEARLHLRVTRPELTAMISTRQVRTLPKPGSRHMYISAASAIAWAERTRKPAAAAAVRAALARRKVGGRSR